MTMQIKPSFFLSRSTGFGAIGAIASAALLIAALVAFGLHPHRGTGTGTRTVYARRSAFVKRLAEEVIAPRCIAVLRGHTNEVCGAAFSPDGRKIVTTGLDGTARLWDAHTGKPIALLRGGPGRIDSAAFSPNSRMVVTGEEHDIDRIWDARTGRLISALLPRARDASPSQDYDSSDRPASSPDSSEIVTGSEGGATLRDVRSGKSVAFLPAPHDWIVSCAFSADGNEIVTVGHLAEGRLWNAHTHRLIAVLPVCQGDSADCPPPTAAVFSPDGTVALTTGLTVRLWDSRTGKPIRTLPGSIDLATPSVFSPDGQSILMESLYDPHSPTAWMSAHLWAVHSGKLIRVYGGITEGYESILFSPDGNQILTASFDDDVARLWDTRTGKNLAVLKGHTGRVWSAAFSPDGREMVTASADHTARLWTVFAVPAHRRIGPFSAN